MTRLAVTEEHRQKHQALLSASIESMRSRIGISQEMSSQSILDAIPSTFSYYASMSATSAYLSCTLREFEPGSDAIVDAMFNASSLAGYLSVRQSHSELQRDLIQGEIDMGGPFQKLFDASIKRALDDAQAHSGIQTGGLTREGADMLLIHFRVVSEIMGYCRGILELAGVSRDFLDVIFKLRRADGLKAYQNNMVHDVPPVSEMH